MRYNRIVLNEPHASVEGLYDPSLSYWSIDARFLNEAVMKLTDWHTDYLFHGNADQRIHTVRFPYSRFIVDAERLWDDPMEQIGQGIIYERFNGFSRTVPDKARQRLLALWKWHQDRLRQALAPGALLLDCHSFPDDGSGVDICIGFNEDWSKPDAGTIDMVCNLFDMHGYRVGVNNPYSNSETPSCQFHYNSMMIEINKAAYLVPGGISLKEPAPGRTSVHELMARVTEELLV